MPKSLRDIQPGDLVECYGLVYTLLEPKIPGAAWWAVETQHPEKPAKVIILSYAKVIE